MVLGSSRFEHNVQGGNFVFGVLENRATVSKELEKVVIWVAVFLPPGIRLDRCRDASPIVVFVRRELDRVDVVVIFY